MVEVECRICLKMTTIDTSFSITTKFLLGKSFTEVILMFVPQMVTAIWIDDVVCFACSRALFTLARFIEQFMAKEEVFKNDNKRIKNACGNIKVEVGESTVIKEEPSELTPQYEEKGLQPRPTQGLTEGSTQNVINGNMEYSHEQPSNSQDDQSKTSPKSVKCRTCFQEIHRLKHATSLSEELLLGKTFKEVILCFVLHMVPTSGNDEIICTSCSKTLHRFAVFIKTCIEVERIYQHVDIKKRDELKRNEVEKSQQYAERLIQILRKKWRMQETAQLQQTLPSQLNFDANNVKRTYTRKVKIKEEVEPSVNEESSEPPLSTSTSTDLIETSLQTVSVKEEESSSPLSNGTRTNWVENSTISCQEYPIEASLMVLSVEEEKHSEHLLFNVTSTDSVENSKIRCQENPMKTSTFIAVKDDIIEISDDDEEPIQPIKEEFVDISDEEEEPTKSPVLTVMKEEFVENSDEDQETIEPPTQSPKDDQGCSDNFFTIKMSDTDEENLRLVKRENLDVTTRASLENSLNDTPPCCSTASKNSDTESEPTDIIKQFKIIKGDSIYNYPIQFHDRVVSISQSNEVLPTFLDDLTMRDILVYHLGKPKDMKNKRVLLLGSAMISCRICEAKIVRSSLLAHMRLMHGTELPRSNNDATYSCVLRPKDKKLPKLENNTLYILDCSSKQPPAVENTYPCPFCKTITYSERLLRKHMFRVHKDFRPYKCEKCGSTFRMKGSYDIHVKTYQDFPHCTFRKCSVCSQMISRNQFSSHVRAHKMFACSECEYLCQSATSLRVHRRIHQQSCPICGKVSAYLANHMRSHEPRNYQCDVCSKRYLTLEGLNRHIKDGFHELVVQCQECNQICLKKNISQHIKLKHSKTKQHICRVCGQQFARADYFKRHMRCHIEGKKPRIRKYSYVAAKFGPVICKYCKKTFTTVPLLKTHLLTHVKVIRYNCRFCDVTFCNPQNRLRHEKKHKDPRFDLRCKLCQSQKKNKEELEEHMKRHKARTIYTCQYCREAFDQICLLHQHIYDEHSEEEEAEKEKQAIFSEALKEYSI